LILFNITSHRYIRLSINKTHRDSQYQNIIIVYKLFLSECCNSHYSLLQS